MPFPFPVSHSQITTYQECPLKFHNKYRRKGQRPLEEHTIAMDRGTSVHKVIEKYMKEEAPEDTTHLVTGLDKEGKAMFKHWLAVCYPSLPNSSDMTIYTERKFNAYLHNYPLMGYMDLFWVDDTGEPPYTAYVCDIKTGSSLYFLEQRLWFSLQPDIYGILARENVGCERVMWIQHNVSADGASIQEREVLLTPDRERTLLYWLDKLDEDCAQPIESYKCGQCPYFADCEGRLRMGNRPLWTPSTTVEVENEVSHMWHSDEVD